MTRNEAIDTLKANYPDAHYSELREAVDLAIKVLEEPERKKGKWIPQDYNKTTGMASTAVYYYPKCSVCGQCANYTNFCPNCGADMRGDGNDN